MWNIEGCENYQYRIRKVGYCKWEVQYKRYLIWRDSGYWFGSRERALGIIERHKQFGSFDPEKQWEVIN